MFLIESTHLRLSNEAALTYLVFNSMVNRRISGTLERMQMMAILTECCLYQFTHMSDLQQTDAIEINQRYRRMCMNLFTITLISYSVDWFPSGRTMC